MIFVDCAFSAVCTPNSLCNSLLLAGLTQSVSFSNGFSSPSLLSACALRSTLRAPLIPILDRLPCCHCPASPPSQLPPFRTALSSAASIPGPSRCVACSAQQQHMAVTTENLYGITATGPDGKVLTRTVCIVRCAGATISCLHGELRSFGRVCSNCPLDSSVGASCVLCSPMNVSGMSCLAILTLSCGIKITLSWFVA